MRFCEILQDICDKRGYSISAISDLTGVAYHTVYSHITGKRFPTKRTFIKYNQTFHFVEPVNRWSIADVYYELKNLE